MLQRKRIDVSICSTSIASVCAAKFNKLKLFPPDIPICRLLTALDYIRNIIYSF